MTGARRTIVSGSRFEPLIGYARAVVVGGMVYVSGTTGSDPVTGLMPDTVTDQCRNALATIGKALAEAGAGFGDVVRVRYILPNPADFESCWPLLRETFAAAPPAATMIAAGVIDPAMKIEIELTAVLPA